MALIFFEDVVPLRLGESAAGPQQPIGRRPIPESSGFLGELKAKTSQKQSGAAPSYPTAWLPTARVARAWEALVTDKAIVP